MLLSLLWLLAAQDPAAAPPAASTEAAPTEAAPFDPTKLKPLKPGEGRAVIECRVLPDGALTDCRVVHEEPVGQGFGEATLRAATKFKMKPLESAGPAPIVRIPMRWRLGRGK